jgi:hypothetical protein
MHWTAFLASAPSAAQTGGMSNWNWGVFFGAVAGGLIGAGIPAVMTWLGWRNERARLREERQWADAEIVADARHFLTDVDPVQRGANINTAPGAEDALWASLDQRRGDVQRRLFRLAAGHPSSIVRSAAKRLEPLLVTAAVQSKWQVDDVIKGRNNAQHLQFAQESYDKAMAALADLERKVKDAGRGN